MLIRCKLEQGARKKRNEAYNVEKDLYLIDSSTLDFVPNADEEVTRAYLLWDAVYSLVLSS